MGTEKVESSLAEELEESREWPLPDKSHVHEEALETGYFQSRSSTPRLDTAEVGRVLPPGFARSQRGPPSIAHSLASPSISELGEGEDPSSVRFNCIQVCQYESLTNAQMARYLGRRATLLGWFDESEAENGPPNWSSTCIAVRLPDEKYSFFPHNINPDLGEAISRLGETAVVAMSSRFTSTLIASIMPGQKSFIVERTSARIPIVYCLNDVNSELVHFARSCIIVQERLVLVWSHDPSAILNVAFDVERQLGKKVSVKFLVMLHITKFCSSTDPAHFKYDHSSSFRAVFSTRLRYRFAGFNGSIN